ncbi:MAG: metalloregulator ArsR/SmtB family transcription factor [Acidimicrobiales bacterium]
MGDRVAKDALFDGFADIAKALANGRRAELIDVLAQGERHVEELADEIGQSLANTSFHLRTLAGAGLVVTRRDKNRIYYQLASDRVIELWSALATSLPHHAELDELAAAYLGHRDEFDELSRTELAADSPPATSSLSTSDRHLSARLVTSPTPVRFPQIASPGSCARCPPMSRSSPTAGARTACSPTKPSDYCAAKATCAPPRGRLPRMAPRTCRSSRSPQEVMS